MFTAQEYYSMMLGLDAQSESPNHYELLGLAPFEDGQNAIRDGALDRHRKLLNWEHSEHHEAAAELMDDVAQAKEILLDPELKRDYDRQLGRKTEPADDAVIKRRREIETARQRVAFLQEDDRRDEALRILSTIVSDKRPEFQADVAWARQTQAKIKQALATERKTSKGETAKRKTAKQKTVEPFVPLTPLPDADEQEAGAAKKEPVVIGCPNCGSVIDWNGNRCGKCSFKREQEPAQTLALESQAAHTLESSVDVLRTYCDLHQHSGYHSGGGIPRDKLANAQKEYGVLRGEQVLAIVDATFIGNAKDGLAICETGIYWHNHNESPLFVTWLDFVEASVSLEKNTTIIQIGDAGKFNLLASECEPKWLLDFLVRLQRRLRTPTAKPAPQPAQPRETLPQARSKLPQAPVIAKVATYCLKQQAKDYFSATSIPPVKLQNARSAYRIPDAEVCFGLIDCTVFGSAKNGLALCATGLYWKNQLNSPQFLAWDAFAVKRITLVGKYDIGFGGNGVVGNFTTAGARCSREWILNFLQGLQRQVASR